MKKLTRGLTVSAIAVAICALTAAGAGASVMLGQQCTPTTSGPPFMLQSAVSSGNTYTAATNGVITKFGQTNTFSNSYPTYGQLVVGHDAGSGNWTFDAAAPALMLPDSATTELQTRLPISKGQSIGILTFPSTIGFCSTSNPADVVQYDNAGEYPSTMPTTFVTSPIMTYRMALWAYEEPDADADGYGDETQDKCPQSAAYFATACPVLSISQQVSWTSKKINILASASVDTQLTAVAVVSIPKIGKSKAKRVTIQGTAKPFTAGKMKTISLKLPSSVKKALKKKKLIAAVTVSGNGLANTATATKKIKLKK